MGLKADLIAAKALIDTPEKWCQGAWRDVRKRHCAFGALVETLTPPDALHADDGEQRKEACIIALNTVVGRPSGFIDFNDDPSTTHADILALFDRAISAAES